MQRAGEVGREETLKFRRRKKPEASNRAKQRDVQVELPKIWLILSLLVDVGLNALMVSLLSSVASSLVVSKGVVAASVSSFRTAGSTSG